VSIHVVNIGDSVKKSFCLKDWSKSMD